MKKKTTKIEDWQYDLSNEIFDILYDVILPNVNWKKETLNGPKIQEKSYNRLEKLIKKIIKESV